MNQAVGCVSFGSRRWDGLGVGGSSMGGQYVGGVLPSIVIGAALSGVGLRCSLAFMLDGSGGLRR